MPPRSLVTGGAGFIGANLVRQLVEDDPDAAVLVVDKLTYAGNRGYLADLQHRVQFAEIDIADADALEATWRNFAPTQVYHLAAESHVDRSISGPEPFIQSNVIGTFRLLECARRHWQGGQERFLHVSTDEVFGSSGSSGPFLETTPYDPSSPYAASKAASDHLVLAYHRTYGIDVVMTNCSNNFGPCQYPEKLIPVMIRHIRDQQPLPIYGDGKYERDWLYVKDHCQALMAVMERGASGRSYNVGAENLWMNIDVVNLLCDLVDDALERERDSRRLISFVADRPGHDRSYAINPTRIRQELGWEPEYAFEPSLAYTVEWYLENFGPLWGMWA